MSTTAILPQDGVEAFITRETEMLATALFCETYGLDRDGAWRMAIELLPELLTYASDWDASAAPPVVFALEAHHA